MLRDRSGESNLSLTVADVESESTVTGLLRLSSIFTSRRFASAVYAMVQSLSQVTSRSCIKMAKVIELVFGLEALKFLAPVLHSAL